MHKSFVQLERGLSGCGHEIEGGMVKDTPGKITDAARGIEGEKRVVVLACRWRHYAGKDLKGLKALSERAEYRLVRVPCSGLVSADWVVRALDAGADAVMVLGGHPSECPFRLEAEDQERRLRAMVRRQGFDPDRLITDWDAAPCARLTEVVGQLMASVEGMGPPFR